MPERFGDERRNALVFKISRRCPVGCSFCCDPRDFDSETLTVAEMVRWTDEVVADIPELIGIISFTGGDPFVHLNEILKVGRVSARHGLDMALITSAFWAGSYEKAFDVLSALRELRLSRFSLSADPGHQVRVPVANVRHALRAAVDLGLVGHVVGTFETQQESLEVHLGETAPPGYKFLSKVIAPYGWAKDRPLTARHYGVRPDLNHWGCYRVYGHDILVQPNGDVLPCCSTTNTVNPLKFGNLRDGDSIAEVVKAITGSFLMRILKHDGFAQLQRIVMRHFPESLPLWPNPEETSGPCGYCVKALGNKELSLLVVRALQLEHPNYLKDFLRQHGTPAMTAADDVARMEKASHV